MPVLYIIEGVLKFVLQNTAVIILGLRPASYTHKIVKRRMILQDMRPPGRKVICRDFFVIVNVSDRFNPITLFSN